MNNLIGISGKLNSGKDTVGKILQWKLSDIKFPETYSIESILNNFGQHINSNPNIEWQIKKFADKLKDITCILLGCTREQLEDREWKEKKLGEEWWYYKVDVFEKTYSTDGQRWPWGIYLVPIIEGEPEFDTGEANVELVKLTPRKLMQLIGTECGREIIHPNIWINALFADYNTGYMDSEEAWCEDGYYNKKVWVDTTPNWIITDVRFPNEAKAIKDRGGIIVRVERDWFTQKAGKYTISHMRGPLTHDTNQLNHPSETALDNWEFDYIVGNNKSIEELVTKVENLIKQL